MATGMVKVVFVDDDFRRMLRSDMAHLQRLIDTGKLGRHKVPYKDKTINVEISKKDGTIYVKKIRVM
jgi:hypothetical protein